MRQKITKDLQDNIGGILDDLNQTATDALEKPNSSKSKVPLKKIVRLCNQANFSLRKIMSPTKECSNACE